MTAVAIFGAGRRFRPVPNFCLRLGRKIYFESTDIHILKTEIGIRRVRQRLPHEAGSIYFVQGAELIKIGYTRSLYARIHKMRTDSPIELTVLHSEPGTRNDEKALHARFEDSEFAANGFATEPRFYLMLKIAKKRPATSRSPSPAPSQGGNDHRWPPSGHETGWSRTAAGTAEFRSSCDSEFFDSIYSKEGDKSWPHQTQISVVC